MKKEVFKVMKKVMIAVSLLIVGSVSSLSASVQIPMHVVNDGSASSRPTYAPPRPWYITQDDYVLTLPAFEDDLTLELRDEDCTVVYSTYVSAGTTTVVLPSTLSGEYELRLIPFSATYYYRGYLIF